MRRDEFRKYMLLSIAVFAVLMLLAVAWIVISPDTGPSIPGSNPEVAVETKVIIQNDLFVDPYIKEIQNRVLTSGELADVEVMKTLWWWTWTDKVTVRLTVIAPNGKTMTTEKIIEIEELKEMPVIFIWTTKQTGVHSVVVTLYNEDGSQIDQKEATVTI